VAEGEGEMTGMLSAMEYPHWLMVAGAVLVVVGFIGFAFHRNNAERISDNPEQTSPNDEANRARPNGNGLSRPIPSERLMAARASVSAAAGLKAKGK
jgi:hypothetical protein